MTDEKKPERDPLSCQANPNIIGWASEVVSDEVERVTEPLLKTTERKDTCYPHKIDVNQKRRTVQCSKCGIEFTHWDALVYIVRNFDVYGTNLSALQHDVERLVKTRESLRKQVHALKAMATRRLGR